MEPFLKWPGGKRWLTANHDLFPSRREYNRYFEPFLGGAAVFFHMEPDSGVLSDLNGDLINTYEVIRDNFYELNQILLEYNGLHDPNFYYEMRSNIPECTLLQAARFIYLNRTCWNGLYRVNKKGQFNVPIGTKTKVILDSDNFENLSVTLRRMTILEDDFEVTINLAGDNDFIFIDPPYTVKHNLNGFVKYNEKIFSWEDQIRLRDAVIKAKDRGAKVLVLNADHASIKDLYSDIGTMFNLNRASVISGDPSARGIYSELVVKCW